MGELLVPMTILILLVLLTVVVLISWWATKLLIKVLLKHQIVDTPNDRSMHQGSVPRGGGIVIVACLLIALIAVGMVSQRYQVFGALTILVLAWAVLSGWDDKHDLSPRKRIVFQLLFAYMSIAALGYVSTIQLNASSAVWLASFGAIATFVSIIGLANLYNFMDGMDGLAAAQTIVASVTMSFWFWQAGDSQLGLVCLVLGAASYGFLLHNWQPAKVFMGDIGSVTIGAFFALMIVFANTRYQIPVLSFVLLFGVFVFDASVTMLRRIIRREKIWLPHRTHFYQRLALAGIDHSRVVIAAIVLMVFCSMIASCTVIDHDRIAFGSVLVILVLACAAGFVVFKETQE
ncbi:MAG: Fuc2NAc and GlcNAc transferase [Dinoroseobacter sp.]|jgi:Fuc2NAc and GlcNAc transferase